MRREQSSTLPGDMPDPITIHREDLTSEVAAKLIKALNAELSATYPEEGATHFRLDPEETAEGRGAFLVARIDGMPERSVAWTTRRQRSSGCTSLLRFAAGA
jgi:hypothetical protein